jgi:uncharacterized protein
VKSAPRAVLDTNVVLSALLFGQGRLAPLRLAWQRATFQALVSKTTTEELLRALAYPKFKLTTEDRLELVADYLPYCTTIAMPAKSPRIPSCRDPFDLAFLELAVVAKADYLVSGDKDMRNLVGKIPCRIVTAGDFLDIFHKAAGE